MISTVVGMCAVHFPSAERRSGSTKAAMPPRVDTLSRVSPMKILLLVALAATLSACAGTPGVMVGPDPSDPTVPVGSLRHTPATDGLIDLKPAEPKPWADSNRSVSPKSGAAE